MHPRLVAGNANVALVGFEKVISAKNYVKGEMRQIAIPVADLLRQPNGDLDRQVLFGTPFEVIARDDVSDFSFGRVVRDGYVGYIHSSALQGAKLTSHTVSALSSHIYPKPNMKTVPFSSLPFGAMVQVIKQSGDFWQIHTGGFIPVQHLSQSTSFPADFVAVLERFLGAPYLWGGDSIWGMDCSGALQLALHSSGQDCPRDSDMQVAELGIKIPVGTGLQRGDLIFWQGHVGVMRDAATLIHANAFHMTVAAEPLAQAATRIAEAGGGDVTCQRRIAS